MKKILFFYIPFGIATFCLTSCNYHAEIIAEQKSISEDGEKIFALQGTHPLVMKNDIFILKEKYRENGKSSQKIYFSWQKDSSTIYSAYIDPTEVIFRTILDSSKLNPTITFYVGENAYYPNAILYTGDGDLQDHISNFVKKVVVKFDKKDSSLFKLY